MKEYTEEEIKKRIRNSIHHLQNKRPKARILLVMHAGYSDGEVNNARKEVYKTLNRWLGEVFMEFKDIAGNRLLITKIKLSNDAFVDGTHPSDLGMEQYAIAYEKALTNLLGR